MPTWKALVDRIWGQCTDKQAEVLLWHCTAFPFVSVFHVARQLKDIKKRSGGDFDKAWRIADEDMNKAMNELDN